MTPHYGGGISSVRLYKGTVQFIVCIGAAFAGSPLARAQDAVPATLRDISKRTGATPTPSAEQPRSKPTLEISAATPNETAGPLVDQTPPPEELATPAATTEEREPRLKRRAIVQRKSPESPPATQMSLSAAKAMAISAPLPDYAYKARRAHITGNGVCVISVDTTNGRVTDALMAQSTGSAVLDKITTDTFRQWRFKPGTVSQVQVPITYQ